MIGAQFKRNLIIAMPYTIHAVLTNNGIRSHQPCSPKICSRHVFDRACDQNGAVHRLTTVKHPWVNGQIDPMNRTIQLATVKRYHYDSHNQLRQHLGAFVAAYCGSQAEGPQRPHTPWSHLQGMAERARSLYVKPASSDT